MLQHSITKDEIMEIANEFLKGLDPQQENDKAQVANALQLYRSGLVYNVDFDGYTLSGTIGHDGNIYCVNIPIRNVSESYCDCFSPTQCEHMLAVLLYAASSFGQVGDILTLFKKKTKPALPPIRTARQMLQNTNFTDTDYESWFPYFESEYKAFAKEYERLPYKQMYFLMNIFTEFYMKMERNAPRIVTVHELFKLSAALFSFQKLLKEIEIFEADELYSYHQPINIVRIFVTKIESIVQDLKAEPFQDVLQPFLQNIAQMLHTIFFSTSSYTQERFFIYRYLWGELFLEPDWIQEELKRIEEKMDPLSKALASSHLLFLQRKDEEAMDVLKMHPPIVVSLYFDWLEDLLSSMQFERARKWLSFTYKRVKEMITTEQNRYLMADIVYLFMVMYETYATHTNEQAGYEMILQELLPYSFGNYEQYALAKRQYHTWTELCLLYGLEGIELLKEPLKEVEKEAPEAALPLYHYAAMKAIEEKNRKSYRRAVRYLKKLRTLYKKLKRTDEWESFIIIIASSHSRLRALQEEMRKGKLIP